MSAEKVLKLIKDKNITYVDLRFTDLRGVQQHVTFPAHSIDESTFEDGKMFDGSSIAGWKGINESDMVLMPDPESALVDPFLADPTLILNCDVLEPNTMQAYSRDPRSLAKRAEAYLKSTGIADTAYFGPEPEFFIFDSVRWQNDMGKVFFEVESEEAAWSSKNRYEEGNSGHRPGIKGGYFPVPPVDSLQDLRAEMCNVLTELGQVVEVHHHEVATAGQCEIGVQFSTLTQKADELLALKYVVKNVAHRNGKTATFMAKPLVGDNGSGMHVHQSLAKGGVNLFSGDLYGGLSQTALWYIGGIFKHAKAINADDEQLQASRAGFRSTGHARLFGAQSLGQLPHSVCVESQGAPHRSAFPRSDEFRLPHVRRAADGRSRRHHQQDRSGRSVGQGSLRSAARRGKEHSAGLFEPRPGARSARQGPRIPQGRRRVLRRLHRWLHRTEDDRGHQVPRGHAPDRIPDVLLGLIRAGGGEPPAFGPNRAVSVPVPIF
jgi:hypothetical protein